MPFTIVMRADGVSRLQSIANGSRSRITRSPHLPISIDWTTNLPLDEFTQDDCLLAYLHDDEELSRVFEYQSVEGPRFKNSIEELFTQLFGHSSYHRGQIASHVRSLGGEPAVTDFVYWSRIPG